jgi:PPM family protein phosphatase
LFSRIQSLLVKKSDDQVTGPAAEVPDFPAASKGSDEKTLPLSEVLASMPAEAEPAPEEVKGEKPDQICAAYAQAVGLIREHNEDAVFSLTAHIASDTRLIPFGLYIVADGMGGHQNGEVASAIAVRAVASYILRKVYLPLLSPTIQTPEDSLQEIMQDALTEANKSIFRQALGGGTTVTAALIINDQMTVAHVGDSRAYAVREEGGMELLTRDHSLVGRLEELGQITAEEAANHPQRNVLYRALGQGTPADADIMTAAAPQGGFVMLCSDGLWGVVEESQIESLILNAPSLDKACQELVQAANQAGGPDNISVVLVWIPGE